MEVRLPYKAVLIVVHLWLNILHFMTFSGRNQILWTQLNIYVILRILYVG
jgi:hypothetical protein